MRSMWIHFQRFGKVIDVFVPAKRSKQGKKFGFVKYKDVRNLEDMLTSIRAVAVGADKLLVHEARFRRNEVRKPNYHANEAIQTTAVDVPSRSRRWEDLKPRYTEAVDLGEKNQNIADTRHEPPPLVVPIRNEEIQWLATCALAEVRNISTVANLDGILRRAGFSLGSVKYLGGLRVLIKCASADLTDKLVSAGNNQLKTWFSSVTHWNRKMEETNTGRVCWFNITGVPLHAWNPRTFEAIAERWGTVLEIEDLTCTRQQLHQGRVRVLTEKEE